MGSGFGSGFGFGLEFGFGFGPQAYGRWARSEAKAVDMVTGRSRSSFVAKKDAHAAPSAAW